MYLSTRKRTLHENRRRVHAHVHERALPLPAARRAQHPRRVLVQHLSVLRKHHVAIFKVLSARREDVRHRVLAHCSVVPQVAIPHVQIVSKEAGKRERAQPSEPVRSHDCTMHKVMQQRELRHREKGAAVAQRRELERVPVREQLAREQRAGEVAGGRADQQRQRDVIHAEQLRHLWMRREDGGTALRVPLGRRLGPCRGCLF